MSAADPAFDLAVVGAGPAGRALAHRALVAGHRVAVIDPAPDRRWTATLGSLVEDLPAWLPIGDTVAAASDTVTVFTPRRRDVPLGYAVFDTAALQTALDLSGAVVLAEFADEVTRRSVRTRSGTEVSARHVVDTRAPRNATAHAAPRQTAVGRFVDADRGSPDMVLMDWRPSPAEPATTDLPSFGYRVAVGAGRTLVEETCLIGAPALSFDELRRRGAGRAGITTPTEDEELVDFPLYTARTPWRTPGACRFGAAGGLMHPATGYSVAMSFAAVDALVAALDTDEPLRAALWPRSNRIAYALRLTGSDVLLRLDAADTRTFFDSFFALPARTQLAYLSGRSGPGAVARAMWDVWCAVPVRLKARVAAASARSVVTSRSGRR